MTDDDFRPACMEPDELETWLTSNSRTYGNERAPRPCDDCLVGFAIEMRAVGRCNGEPGGADEQPDEEVLTMAIPMTTGGTTADVRVEAPCGTCSHAPVCRLRSAVEATEEVSVGFRAPDPAVSIEMTATIKCDHYRRVSNGGRRKRETTPAQREAMAANLQKAREARAAKRDAGPEEEAPA